MLYDRRAGQATPSTAPRASAVPLGIPPTGPPPKTAPRARPAWPAAPRTATVPYCTGTALGLCCAGGAANRARQRDRGRGRGGCVMRPAAGLSWTVTGLSRTVTGLSWTVTGLSWTVTGLSWTVTGLSRTVTGLSWASRRRAPPDRDGGWQ
eukprot:9479236-Pyramimonas_sp.AAC.1